MNKTYVSLAYADGSWYYTLAPLGNGPPSLMERGAALPDSGGWGREEAFDAVERLHPEMQLSTEYPWYAGTLGVSLMDR